MLGPVLRGSAVTLEPTELDDLHLFRARSADLDVVRHLHYRFTRSADEEEEWL